MQRLLGSSRRPCPNSSRSHAPGLRSDYRPDVVHALDHKVELVILKTRQLDLESTVVQPSSLDDSETPPIGKSEKRCKRFPGGKRTANWLKIIGNKKSQPPAFTCEGGLPVSGTRKHSSALAPACNNDGVNVDKPPDYELRPGDVDKKRYWEKKSTAIWGKFHVPSKDYKNYAYPRIQSIQSIQSHTDNYINLDKREDERGTMGHRLSWKDVRNLCSDLKLFRSRTSLKLDHADVDSTTAAPPKDFLLVGAESKTCTHDHSSGIVSNAAGTSREADDRIQGFIRLPERGNDAIDIAHEQILENSPQRARPFSTPVLAKAGTWEIDEMHKRSSLPPTLAPLLQPEIRENQIRNALRNFEFVFQNNGDASTVNSTSNTELEGLDDSICENNDKALPPLDLSSQISSHANPTTGESSSGGRSFQNPQASGFGDQGRSLKRKGDKDDSDQHRRKGKKKEEDSQPPGQPLKPTLTLEGGGFPCPHKGSRDPSIIVAKACDTLYPDKTKLKEHLERAHLRQFECPWEGCSFRAGTHFEINRHQKSKHTSQKKPIGQKRNLEDFRKSKALRGRKLSWEEISQICISDDYTKEVLKRMGDTGEGESGFDGNSDAGEGGSGCHDNSDDVDSDSLAPGGAEEDQIARDLVSNLNSFNPGPGDDHFPRPVGIEFTLDQLLNSPVKLSINIVDPENQSWQETPNHNASMTADHEDMIALLNSRIRQKVDHLSTRWFPNEQAKRQEINRVLAELDRVFNDSGQLNGSGTFSALNSQQAAHQSHYESLDPSPSRVQDALPYNYNLLWDGNDMFPIPSLTGCTSSTGPSIAPDDPAMVTPLYPAYNLDHPHKQHNQPQLSLPALHTDQSSIYSELEAFNTQPKMPNYPEGPLDVWDFDILDADVGSVPGYNGLSNFPPARTNSLVHHKVEETSHVRRGG